MAGSAQTGQGKADFSHIYDRPDPRDYFRTLGALDYEIPQQAQPVFDRLLDTLRQHRDAASTAPRVLDLCCSYGVNAALLRCDISLDDLFDRYASPELDDLSPQEVWTLDRRFFGEHVTPNPPLVSGLDTAANAIGYACRTGLLDSGWTEDLESADPSPDLVARLGDFDLITATGGIGYITHRTLDRVVRPVPGRHGPWIAAFVLRQISYEPIGETLAARGFVTEHLSTTSFPQRRFASPSERDSALHALADRGLDPDGLEADGRYYADLYLTRPAADVADLPLDKLLDGVVAPP